MGMKSAACWFANQWSVRTSALGESVERVVQFDIKQIIEDKMEELDIRSSPANNETHFTEITLSDLNYFPKRKTISKIKDHLSSIYRVFLRENKINIKFNGDYIAYEDPDILNVPHYRDGGSDVVWRKEIDFDFGEGQHATGFAALRARGSTSLAGFALFRRNRLIEGSMDDTYRPEFIFGKTNSYRYQRLFGEIHLEGFEVSHTKDGFRWEESEEPFLELLMEHLREAPHDLLMQAEEYRVRVSRTDLAQAATGPTNRTADIVQRDIPPILENQINSEPDNNEPAPDLPQVEVQGATREINIELNGAPWRIVIETVVEPAIGDWISVSDCSEFEDPETGLIIRRLGLRLSLAHPFMDRFCGTDSNSIEILLRVSAALGLGITAARDVGASMTNTIIRNINDLLRNGLSKP